MSDLLETLQQEGVDPALLAAVQEYRAAHPLSEALRPRIPAPAFTYYGKEVWEQALAAVQQAEPMASGEMEQRMLALVRYRLEQPDYLHDDTYGTQLLDCFQRLRDTYPMGFTRFHLPWVLAWYKANRQYRQACRLLEEFPVK